MGIFFHFSLIFKMQKLLFVMENDSQFFSF